MVTLSLVARVFPCETGQLPCGKTQILVWDWA